MAQEPTDVPAIPDYQRLLEGRVTVVTGGGDGIGGAISRLFAEHGALVEIGEIDPDRAKAKQAEIEAAGNTARAHVVDVRDDEQVAVFAEAVTSAHNGRVDVLVNNVGDYRPLVRFQKSNAESWDAMYQQNMRHFFSVTRAFLEPMIESGGGSIVNVHSVEGMRGYPGEPVYGAMKGGIAHFTTCLAAEQGRNGVRVNGIGPDLTQTPQVDYGPVSDYDHMWPYWAPVGRLGWPEDQARVALFLASDMSAYVTGHNIPVDGGTKTGGGWFFSPTQRRFTNRPLTL
jgi:NAD(P)-dependent dehydrogenase (short-subunit alcohol dehydrogenase family)